MLVGEDIPSEQLLKLIQQLPVEATEARAGLQILAKV